MTGARAKAVDDRDNLNYHVIYHLFLIVVNGRMRVPNP